MRQLAIRVAVTVLLLLAASPAVASACTCVTTSIGPPPPARHWANRPAVFVGHAIEVDPPHYEGRHRSVLLVTEESWRGALPDTVRLWVGANAPCAHYVPGGRYLVLADRDAQQGARLVAAGCDESWRIDSPVAVRWRAELGPAPWTAPPAGARALDTGVVRLGTAVARTRSPGLVVLVVPNNEDISRFELGDVSETPRASGGSILYLKPGLYQFRLTWTDGTVYQSYLAVSCDIAATPENCQVLRTFRGLR